MRILNTLATLATLALFALSVSASAQTSSATEIYAIKDNGDMLFYKHTGTATGSPDWSIQAKKIGNGWNFKQVLAGR